MIARPSASRRPLEMMVDSAAFPVVGANVTDFATVHVERFPQKDNAHECFVAPAARLSRADITRTLLAGRSGEPAETRLEGVVITFETGAGQDVDGRSCELALALADKRARARQAVPVRRIIATGRLRQDRSGAVDPIERFDAKCRGVLHECARAGAGPVWFCFPAANWEEADGALREALQAQERRGRVKLRAAAHICELDDFWRPLPAPAPRRARLLQALSVLGAAALLAGAAGSGAAAWRAWPVWECGRALAEAQSSGDGDWGEPARTCRRAVERRPDSGRAHSLLGNVYAHDGAATLARRHWRRAAMLGDPDGMMSWGWLLWIDPGAPEDRSEALDWLRAAAAEGETAAMERLAIALREEGTGHTNHEEAEQWWTRALRER